ncbi:alpha/beta hydrolase [Deinococcus hohokamensis]|uniref:Alpha/beta hydrolase n=1 Tax=Deinococcus hohokamensis TaxID=309883 RepID=A0ABV9I716_9DEIO
MTDLKWIHHLDRGTASDLTLLLLHGTGGNEAQLLPLGRQVAPGATLLGVRGRSLEEGFPRYFRRFSAIEYDQAQIRSEAAALAQFVREAAQAYDLNPARIVALGYSNGANMALATLALHPQTFLGAALLRPVMPLEEPPQTDLGRVSALVLHGAHDPYAAHASGVVPYLKGQGAAVQSRLLNAGHELGGEDLHLTAEWLAGLS